MKIASLCLALLFSAAAVHAQLPNATNPPAPAASPGAPAKPLRVTVVDDTGKPVPNATVVLVLKSNAYQKATPANGSFTFKEPVTQSGILFAAAPDHLSTSIKSPADGDVTVKLTSSPTRSSQVLSSWGTLADKGGNISVGFDTSRQFFYMYAKGISLMTGSEHPAPQPLYFRLFDTVNATSSSGQKFKIYLKENIGDVSRVDYTK